MKTFKIRSKDGVDVDFKISRLNVVDDPEAPVILLRKIESGEFVLTINKSFDLGDILDLEIQTIKIRYN